MEPVTVYLKDRRVKLAERMELVTHALAAFTLVTAALDGGADAGTQDAAVAFVQLVAGAALAGAIVRELRPAHGGGRHGVSWVNLFAAGALFLEVWQRVDAGGKFSWATFLTAVITLAMGFLAPRLATLRETGRFVRLDDAGITLRRSRLRGTSVPWTDVAGLRLEPGAVRVERRGGRARTLGLRFIANRAEVVEAVGRVAAERGIAVSGGAAILPRATEGAAR